MKKIVIILVILIGLLLVLSWLNSRSRNHTKALLVFIDQQGSEYPIYDFPTNKAEELVLNKGKKISGIPLSVMMPDELQDKSWQILTFYSRDGAKAEVRKKEFNDLYLMQVAEADTSFLRLIIPKDDFHHRWLKYVDRIQLK